MDRECVPFWGDYHCHYGLGQSLFMTSNQMMKIQKYSEFIFKQTAEYSWLISSAAAKPLETCSANRRVHLTALSGYVWGKFCVFYTLLPPTCIASLRSLALFFYCPQTNDLNPNKLKRIEYCSPCWIYRFYALLLPMMLYRYWNVWIWHFWWLISDIPIKMCHWGTSQSAST